MLVTDDNKHILLETVVREKLFAIDTETNGLEWNDTAFCATIATKDKEFYTEDLRIIKHLYHLPLEVIMINAKFDMRMLGIPFYSPWDIRDISLLGRILKNDEISIAAYSLDKLAKKYAAKEKSNVVDNYIKAYKVYEERRTKFTNEMYKVPRYDKVDRTLLREYALLDARLTYDIYIEMKSRADEDDMRVFYNECRLLHCTYKMEMDGIRLDEAKTQNALEKESILLDNAKEEFRTITGEKYANTKSVLIPIFTKAGEHITLTKKGNPRLTDEDLESFTSIAAKSVQKIRFHEKRISTYFTSYMDLVDDKGYIHPTMVQHGTATGRFSYKNPNLQNCPKDEPDYLPHTVRGCFVPEEGNIFLSRDYSQQEYRVMLDYANERKVISEILAGKDVHQAIADMAGITRKRAKTLSFAILYGSGPKKIAEMLDIRFEEARTLRDNYLLSLPGVDNLIGNVIKKSKTTGYVKNWMGRKLRNSFEYSYKAPNHLIQGGCGDIIKTAMVQIHEILKGTGIKMRLQIHDELLFEGTREELMHKDAEICIIMQEAYTPKNGMLLTTDASYSEISFAERDMRPWI